MNAQLFGRPAVAGNAGALPRFQNLSRKGDMSVSKSIWQPMKNSRSRTGTQPQPRTPGITRKMVSTHARRIFRDVLRARVLTKHEWRVVEMDLVRWLESNGW